MQKKLKLFLKKIIDTDETLFLMRETQVANHIITTCLETELKTIAPSIRKDIDEDEPA